MTFLKKKSGFDLKESAPSAALGDVGEGRGMSQTFECGSDRSASGDLKSMQRRDFKGCLFLLSEPLIHTVVSGSALVHSF